MILISLSLDGSAACRAPQQLAQGTDSENIVLASPFPARVPILMGWVMPDRTPLEQWVDPSDHTQGKTKYFAMTNVIDGGDFGVGNEAPLSVWTFRPDKAFTAQYGTAYACFYAQLQDQNGGISYRKLTTNLVAIEVLETIKPDIDDEAPEGSLLEEILQAITYYNEYLEDIAENGVSTVFDTLGEEQRKVYTDAVATLGSLNLITSDAVAQVLNDAKDYADTKDTETLNAAKSYTNTQLIPYATKEYADEKANEAGAAAVVSANGYTDTKATQTLNSAESYTDGKVEIINTQIEQLEGRTARLLYTASTDPTALQINAFAISKGYSAPFQGVAVVVDVTYHIWHYYTDGTGWKDDGLDTVITFTNSLQGVIKGSTDEGKVNANPDGTGNINGWDELKNRVASVEGNVIYCAYDGSKFQLPLGSIEDGKHYTLVFSMTNAQYNNAITESSTSPVIYMGNPATAGATITLVGDRFGILSGSNGATWKYYELNVGIGNQFETQPHIFVFSGVASYYQAVGAKFYDFRLDKNIAKNDSVYIHPSDYALVPYSVLKPVSQKADQNAADIVTVNTKITDDRLRIANLENSLYDYVLGKDEETFDNLKNAILPSSITVDDTVYPIADGAYAILSCIKGKTRQLNQLFNSGGSVTYQKTITAFSQGIPADGVLVQYATLADGHKFFLRWESDNPIAAVGDSRELTTGIYAKSDFTGDICVAFEEAGTATIKFNLCDITVMELDTITTVEEFNAIYGDGYYAYNPGTLYDSIVSGVSLTEKNLIPFTLFNNVTNNGVTFDGRSGTLHLSGTCTGGISQTATFYKNKHFTLPAGTYYFRKFKSPPSGYYARIKKYSNDTDLISSVGTSFTITEDTEVYYSINISSGAEFGTDYELRQILSTSIPTEYAPYALHTINLPSALTLGGVGTAQDEWKVTRNENDDYYTEKKTVKIKTIDLSTLTFTESGGVYSATISDMKSDTTNYVLSKYGTEATVSGTTLSITTSSTPTGTIAYELATPTEETITTTATLADVSAIRTNGGMISVVGNDNEDYTQPDVSEYVTYEKADLTGGN